MPVRVAAAVAAGLVGLGGGSVVYFFDRYPPQAELDRAIVDIGVPSGFTEDRALRDGADDYPFVGFTPWTTQDDPLPSDVGDFIAAGEPPVLVCLGTWLVMDRRWRRGWPVTGLSVCMRRGIWGECCRGWRRLRR